jgi:hypothetical protein
VPDDAAPLAAEPAVETSTVEVSNAAAPEHPALIAYRRRVGRANRVYAAILVALVVLAFVAVKLAYAHGELNKVSFTTAPAPADLPGSTPGSSLKLAWHTADAPAVGDPYSNGVVVTYAGHTVNGRDAVTGQVRWHYTRSDETLCSVVQQDASTIAIYRRKGNCDEVTGFATATGEPKWYRTLMDSGDTSVSSMSNVVMTVNASIVHVFDNAGGLDRWNWSAPAGCAVRRALAGSAGVLIQLRCGDSTRLALHDLLGETVRWTVSSPLPVVPIAASTFLGAVDPATGTVYRYSSDKGVATKSASIAGARIADEPLSDVSVSTSDAAGQQLEFVSAGKLVAFYPDGTVRWSAAATGRPWLVTDAFVASRDAADQVVLRRINSGQVQLVSTLSPAPPTGESRVFAVGSGLLLAGGDVSVYR